MGADAVMMTALRVASGSIGSEWSCSHSADLLGTLDDRAAALVAPLAERLERGGHGHVLRQLLGEHDAVLDRLGGALAAVRRGSVRRVADQHDPPAMPRRAAR